MAKPSRAYGACIEDCRRHHASSKTFSGRFLRPHAPFIGEVISRLGCETVLDYGAGKGLQYEWINPETGRTIEQDWGVQVHKYDPAWPPFAAKPEGPFDLVICTHVLGSVPVVDLGWVVDRLYALAGKALYVAEKIGPVKKQVLTHAAECAVGWTAEQWKAALRRDSGIEVTLATRERRPEGVIVERWRACGSESWAAVSTAAT
jgi:hypothetical protein